MDTQLLVGNTLGSYEVLRELGRGGMGIVYKAHEQSLQRIVALKVLPEYLARDPSFVKRFRREAQAAAQLNHPNIVTVHAVGECDGVHYIAMEYVRGQTLGQHLQEQGQLDVRHALEIARQTAEALAEAHKRGIIHRDIKPSNIMLDEAGRVKVMDFGLAKALHGMSEITASGLQVGTPRYMAPEQIQGESLDARSDIFSLGLVIAEMLTGRAPFAADTPSISMYQIVHQELPDLREMNSEIPPLVAELIGRMTAKARENRPPSAQAVVSDLDFILHNAPGTASLKEVHEAPTRFGGTDLHGAHHRSSTPKRARSRLFPLIAALVSVTGIAAVVIAGLWFGSENRPLFPDQRLEAALRETLGKPEGELTTADVAGLTNLKAEDRGISDLTGLNLCANLTDIWLVSNAITNLEPLKHLTNLEKAALSINHISDVAPLENHPTLRELYLEWNSVVDIRPLATLRQIELLNLKNNRISDLSPLAEMNQLTWLEISANPIADYQPLTHLTNLRILNMDDMKDADLKAISGLTSLQQLFVARSNVTDISSLAALENLEVLRLNANRIQDIGALQSLHRLRELILSGNEIVDLTPLVDNPGLGAGDVLYLTGNPEYAGQQAGGNPLSEKARTEQVPLLEARGVKVFL